MKKLLKINLILFSIIPSYLLIAVRGEHLAGPLGLFLFLNLFNNINEIFYGIVPTLGIILLITTMFINRKRKLYLGSMLCLYTTLILYIISLIKDKEVIDEVTPLLSMIPFVILTIIGALLLRLYAEPLKG